MVFIVTSTFGIVLHSNTSRISINIAPNEDFVQTTISDFGIGTSLQFQDSFHNPEWTFHNTSQFGLELFIIKKLVDKYKGRILIQDSLPSRTIFIINLLNAVKEEYNHP